MPPARLHDRLLLPWPNAADTAVVAALERHAERTVAALQADRIIAAPDEASHKRTQRAARFEEKMVS